mgnify:CR=1 FL=1
MVHAFLLYVFIGVNEDRRLVSNDMYFRDVTRCAFFAKALHKQGNLVTAYCLPKMVSEEANIYD